MIFPNLDGFGFDTRSSSAPQGTFCTDWKGWEMLDCSDPQAVTQYLKPGVLFELTDGPGKWEVQEPWRAVYENFRPQLVRIDRNIEDHVLVPSEN